MRKYTILLVALSLFQGTAFSQSCLPEGISFSTQAQIDSFHINYPNCTEITGEMNINGNDISDLTGLNVLTSVQGEVVIGDFEATNPLLTSCIGLENLIYIGGSLLLLSNEAMTSCTGLTNLSNIGGGVGIAGNPVLSTLIGFDNLKSVGGLIGIQFNPVLVNMTGLDSLISLGDAIYIEDNDNLTSLKGMDNINAGTIAGLTITGNPNLSTCEVRSLCNYLVSPAGSIEINNNASGCNSQEEVEEACELGIEEKVLAGICTIFPNPFTGETSFSIHLKEPTQVNLLVMDRLGRVLATVVNESLSKGTHNITWNVVGMPSGIYYYRLTAIGLTANGKLVVVR